MCVVLSTPKAAGGNTHAEALKALERAKNKVEAPLEGHARHWYLKTRESGKVSMRTLEKITRVARTIAAMEGLEKVEVSCLQEAWELKCPDTFAW